jgi:RimJ/RimL family protein N-acetyltransferase
VTLIVTDRLVLGTLSRDEAAAIRAGDRRGRAWADDYPSEGDVVVAQVVGEAGEHYDESAVYGPLQVRATSTGLAVGGIGFLSAPDPDGFAEIGYGLVPSARGLGYATEAVSAVLLWAATTGLAAIEAMTQPDNLASQRVLARCGFAFVDLVDGGTEDGPLQRWVRRPLT